LCGIRCNLMRHIEFLLSIVRRCAAVLAVAGVIVSSGDTVAQWSEQETFERGLFNPRGRSDEREEAQLVPSVGAGPEIWAFDDTTPWVQRFGIAERIGDGLGYQDSYTTFEFFTPIRGDQRWENLFLDARMNASNNGTLGANIGVGYRVLNDEWNRIFGVNAYFDHMETELTHIFQQFGVGVESLGPLFDVRANVYIPDVGASRGQVANRFTGHILIINRDIVSMPGADVEIGGRLPVLWGVQGSAYVGAYHFDGRGTPNATGWKARAQIEFNEWAWGDVQYQDDDLFGQTFSVGIALRYRHRWEPPATPAYRSMDHLFFRRPGSDWRDIGHRLSDPVERLQYIVTTSDPQIARDSTGTPLNFLHVVPGAAGVTGTFEDPFGTLGAALADAAAGTSYIYTPEGGDFVENVTLVPGAQVLSNGPIQRVPTTLGQQRLPFSGRSIDLSDLPTVLGDVAMDDDSRFSGFDVTGQLTATGVMGFTVDNSVIENPAGNAVVLTGVDSGTLDNLRITSGAGIGLVIADSIDVSAAATDRVVDFNNLTVTAAGAVGLDVTLTGAGNLTINLDGTNSIATTGTAFNAITAGGSTGDLVLSIEGTTFSSTAGAGINVNGVAGAGTTFISSFADNSVTRAATGGALFDTVTFDADPTTVAIDQVDGRSLTIGASNSNNLVGDGLRLLDPTGDLKFTTLNIFNRNGTGLLVDTKGGGTTFNLETEGGTIITTNGAAMSLDPLTVDLVFAQVQSTNSPTSGIFIDTTSGRITIDSTILNGSTNPAVFITNTPAPLTVHLGDLSIESTISDNFDDNVDTSVNNMGNVTVTTESVSIEGP
jgi:hypothetical protein